MTKYSQRYQEADQMLHDNPQITNVVGQSLGGSVALELEKNNPQDKLFTTTYGAPVYTDSSIYANRFRLVGDPVSMSVVAHLQNYLIVLIHILMKMDLIKLIIMIMIIKFQLQNNIKYLVFYNMGICNIEEKENKLSLYGSNKYPYRTNYNENEHKISKNDKLNYNNKKK